jgi:hypothetical protein
MQKGEKMVMVLRWLLVVMTYQQYGQVNGEHMMNQSIPAESPTFCERGVGCYTAKDVQMPSYNEWTSEDWRPLIGGCVAASILTVVLPLMFLVVAVVTNSHEKTSNITRRFSDGEVVIDMTQKESDSASTGSSSSDSSNDAPVISPRTRSGSAQKYKKGRPTVVKP